MLFGPVSIFPQVWNENLIAILEGMEFKQCIHDPGMFVHVWWVQSKASDP